MAHFVFLPQTLPRRACATIVVCGIRCTLLTPFLLISLPNVVFFHQARLGSTLGYDTLARAAHGAGVAIHARQYSLWLEASLRRVGGATARLAPPFERLVTSPGRALAVAVSANGLPSLEAARHGGSRASHGGPESQAEGGERGRGEARGAGRRRGWKRRSPGRRGGAAGLKDGIAWVPRALPKLSHSLGRGSVEGDGGEEEEEEEEEEGGRRGLGGARVRRVEGGKGKQHTDALSKAHMFDELWLPSGLVTLAQDVLLINRARGGVGVRGDERYFIAQARGAPSGTSASESGYPLWKPAASKFRGLEAAVFPFLLLPLVPAGHQPQAAGQMSRLLDANPANAAVLCHLRAPLALLKLACLLPEQSRVRGLYFRLAAQLMSHHISAADARELFHLASLEPSAWARLGRLRVTSLTGADFISARGMASGAVAEEGGGVDPTEAAAAAAGVRARHGGRRRNNDNGVVVLPAHSGELQMQLLYVIGTVVDSPSPAWFFHMDGSAGSGLIAGPLARFPPKRVGYSLSMWLRPAGFSRKPGGETGLFSICGRRENGAVRALLRVSLRRCVKAGDSSAPPAAAGIGASEDDDGDQGSASDDACAKLQVHAMTEEGSCPGQQQPSGASSSSAGGAVVDGGGGATIASALVAEPDVRCSRWQHLVVTHSYSSDAGGGGSGGQWVDGSVAVYVDGERRALATESAGGKSKRGEAVEGHGALAYPAAAGGGAGPVSASVGCWEEYGSGRAAGAAAPMMDAGVVGRPAAARFSGQIATVALLEGAWTAEMAKASFLRGPGAPPPGKRVVFASPGDLPPTPFLDAGGEVEATPSGLAGGHGQGSGLGGKGSKMSSGAGADAPVSESRPVDGHGGVAEAAVNTGQWTVPGAPSAGAAAPFSGVTPAAPQESPAPTAGGGPPPSGGGNPPGLPRRPNPPTSVAPTRLSVMFAPVRKAIDLKYGVAPAEAPPGAAVSPSRPGADGGEERGSGNVADTSAGGGSGDGKSALLSDSMALTVNSLAVAAGCGGKDKDSGHDSRVSFRLAKGSGTWVYATTPLHAAVQAAGGFRLCLPFLRMDHARQVSRVKCE